MKSIRENISNKIEINKSIFITELIKIKNTDEIPEIMNIIKNKYKDATHYCYAYIIDDKKKSSDDGEPGGTAGVPIMDVLSKYNLNYILCIVIRYFGGIKLGAGGLVRAYRRSVNDALNISRYNELIEGYQLTLEISYDKQKDLEHILKDGFKKEYFEKVKYTIQCTEEIINELKRNYEIKDIKKITIEKEL